MEITIDEMEPRETFSIQLHSSGADKFESDRTGSFYFPDLGIRVRAAGREAVVEEVIIAECQRTVKVDVEGYDYDFTQDMTHTFMPGQVADWNSMNGDAGLEAGDAILSVDGSDEDILGKLGTAGALVLQVRATQPVAAAVVTTLQVNASATVAGVKAVVRERRNILPECQLLSRDGEPLGDGASLASLGAKEQNASLWHLTDFSCLQPQVGGYCQILETERRGITVGQLRQLLAFVRRRRNADGTIRGWKDTGSSSPTFGLPIHYATFNLYQALTWVIKPSTAAHSCSYVELASSSHNSQVPVWFVSHFWGEAIADFIACIEKHVTRRQLRDTSPYWVCAYANNQHELGCDLTRDPKMTSFFKAMRLAVGLLLILDTAATPFQRSWCCFEESTALKDTERREPMQFDVATNTTTGAEVLTDRPVGHESWVNKTKQEEGFPMELLRKCLHVKIQDSSASVEIDKVRILNSIAGLSENRLDDPLPAVLDKPRLDNYEAINNSLCSLFAITCWRAAVYREAGDEMMQELAKALKADSNLQILRLSFEDQLGVIKFKHQLKDAHLVQIGASLPSGLKHMQISCDYCHKLSDTGLVGLVQNLPRCLQVLHLSFRAGSSFKINDFTDAGIKALISTMPLNLKTLVLNFDHVMLLSDDAFVELVQTFPRTLTTLSINFSPYGTPNENRKFDADRRLEALSQNFPNELESLCVSLGDFLKISSWKPAVIIKNLPTSVKSLKLSVPQDVDFRYTQKYKDLGAARAWQRQLRAGSHFMQLVSEGSVEKLRAYLLESVWREGGEARLAVSFVECGNVASDESFAAFALAIPADLTCLEIDLTGCDWIGGASVKALAFALPQQAMDLAFFFGSCKGFGDNELAVMAKAIPEGLSCLRLDLKECEAISDIGVRALAEALPQGLNNLHLNFKGCTKITLDGALSILKRLPEMLKEASVCIASQHCFKLKDMQDLKARLLDDWRCQCGYEIPPLPGGFCDKCRKRRPE